MTLARSRATALSALLLAATLAGCGGGGSGPDCSDRAVRVNIRDLVAEWYLFTANVDEAAFDPLTSTLSNSAYLDALVNAAAGPDAGRGYSYLTTKSANQQFFVEGTSLGFGIGLHFQGASQVLVTQVFGEGMDPAEPKYALRSPAAKAGFQRGDEIVAVAPGTAPTASAANLDAPARQVSAMLAADPTGATFFAALGSSVAGTVRDFRLKRALTGELVDVQATSAIYWLDAVPRYTAPTILTSPGGRKVGYLMLRTFINPAVSYADGAGGTATPLATAFAAFKAAAVTDLIVDLRYNGGGLLDVAKAMVDLMAQGQEGQLAFGLRHNALRAAQYDASFNVAAVTQSMAPTRVAFITGPGSASASELVPFALAPGLGAQVALVGDRSLGKPAGQYGFSTDACPTVYVVLSFQLANRAGRAQYWDGLPDAAWTGSSCAAADDLTHPTGSALETSTLTALQFIDGGQAACTPLPTTPPARVARTVAGPAAVEPTLVQRHIPNLY